MKGEIGRGEPQGSLTLEVPPSRAHPHPEPLLVEWADVFHRMWDAPQGEQAKIIFFARRASNPP